MRRTLAIVAVGIVLVSSCSKGDSDSGSGSGSGSGSTESSAASAAASGAGGAGKPTLQGKVTDKGDGEVKDGKVALEVDDGYFAPTFIKGKAGEEVTVEIESEGTNAHTFTIDSAKVDQAVAPGSKNTLKVTIPSSGAMQFYCKFHVGGGMQGAFYVG